MKFILLIFLVSLLYLPQLMKQDFKIPPTYPQIANRDEWETPPPSAQILSILNQSFTYLTHGNQCTVFTSADGAYVLKLFRYTRSRFASIQNVKCWIAKYRHKKPKHDLFTKMHKTFHAAFIASAEARPFTQVVFCHLNLTDNQLPCTHIARHVLPLDRHRFVLQKKVAPFKDTLLAARNNPEKMHRLIDSFCALIMQRLAAGIHNSDPNLGPNFGFLDDQAVEIDFGNYRKSPYTPQQQLAEITNYLLRLEHFLAKNAPGYSAYLKELHLNICISYDPEGNEAALRRSSGTVH